MSENLKIWDAVKAPPQQALSKIKGGRLNGMTDISPQWRYHVMTETFGPIGIGWTYEIKREWTEPGSENQIAAFIEIAMFVRHDGEWSKGIPGIGGSMLVAKEKNGLHTSDEAFKMAETDAISVAMKKLGVGANIYSKGNDYSKYSKPPAPQQPAQTPAQQAYANIAKELKSCKTMDALDAVWQKAQPQLKDIPQAGRDGLLNIFHDVAGTIN